MFVLADVRVGRAITVEAATLVIMWRRQARRIAATAKFAMTRVVGAMMLVVMLPVLILAGFIKAVAITVEAATQRGTRKIPFKYVALEERKRKRCEQLRVRRSWKKVRRRIAREERARRQSLGSTLLRLSALLMHLAVCHVGLSVALNGFVLLTHLLLVWPLVNLTVMGIAPAWRGRVTNVMQRSLYSVALVSVCSGALTYVLLRWLAAEFVQRKGRDAFIRRVEERRDSNPRTTNKKHPERTPCQHEPRLLIPKAVEIGGERHVCWERRVLDRVRGGVAVRKRRCERRRALREDNPNRVGTSWYCAKRKCQAAAETARKSHMDK